MEIREKTVEVLLKIGFNPATKGFKYICDAMELFNNDDVRNGKTTELYNAIAEKNNDTYSKVERSIRHAFDTTLEKGSNLEMVSKYLTVSYTSNSALLHTLWINLQKELKEEYQGVSPCKEVIEDETANTYSKAVKRVIKGIIEILEKELESL